MLTIVRNTVYYLFKALMCSMNVTLLEQIHKNHNIINLKAQVQSVLPAVQKCCHECHAVILKSLWQIHFLVLLKLKPPKCSLYLTMAVFISFIASGEVWALILDASFSISPLFDHIWLIRSPREQHGALIKLNKTRDSKSSSASNGSICTRWGRDAQRRFPWFAGEMISWH